MSTIVPLSVNIFYYFIYGNYNSHFKLYWQCLITSICDGNASSNYLLTWFSCSLNHLSELPFIFQVIHEHFMDFRFYALIFSSNLAKMHSPFGHTFFMKVVSSCVNINFPFKSFNLKWYNPSYSQVINDCPGCWTL